MKLNVGVDIDGVLSDSIPGFSAEAERRFGVTFSEDQIHGFDIWDYVPLTKSQFSEIFKSPETFRDNRPVPRAKATMQILRPLGDLWIITSRSIDDVWEVTVEWLRKNEIEYDFLTFTKDKAQVAQDRNLSIFIEDSREAANEIAGAIPFVFLFDRPWNRDGKVEKNVIRVEDWNDILRRVNSIYKGMAAVWNAQR